MCESAFIPRSNPQLTLCINDFPPSTFHLHLAFPSTSIVTGLHCSLFLPSGNV
jgi:hypothetical protein